MMGMFPKGLKTYGAALRSRFNSEQQLLSCTSFILISPRIETFTSAAGQAPTTVTSHRLAIDRLIPIDKKRPTGIPIGLMSFSGDCHFV